VIRSTNVVFERRFSVPVSGRFLEDRVTHTRADAALASA
jgi:hypothetical protein